MEYLCAMGQMGWYLFRTDVPGIVVARVSCFFLFNFLLQVRVFVCVAHCSRNILEVVHLFVFKKIYIYIVISFARGAAKEVAFCTKMIFFPRRSYF